MIKLAAEIALVNGSSRGIGRGIALKLSRSGVGRNAIHYLKKAEVAGVTAALSVWFFAAAMGQAATLSTSGATGVNVNGTFYDVFFSDGSCRDLFDGCNNLSDFAFTTQADAVAASQALLNLFNAPGNEFFTNDPSQTVGCESLIQCGIFTPFDPNNTFSIRIVTFVNEALGADFVNPPTLIGAAFDTSGASSLGGVYAVWAKSAPIPLPASLPLLAAGLVCLAELRRRKHKAS